MRQPTSGSRPIRLALIAGTALASALGAIGAAQAQTSPPEQAAPPTTTPPEAEPSAIVVTGFRQSLQAALNLKKASASAVDAIVSEDIAKFPDQNLAESLQRISGVAITRDGGEGREITVRGLGSQFTVTRLNGLPAQATSSANDSANRDRSFDFNVFASELFKSLVVHKTAEANLDEGSLGAVVDLNTGHPLGAKTGLTGLVSASGSWNTLSGNVGPRLAGLLNWKNDDGTLGINASAAYSQGITEELGNNTGRWAQAPFNSVTSGGVTTPCFSGNTYLHSSACDQASLSFHPRFPRYGIITHDRQRLGITGAIEWQPDDATHLEIDGLFSRFHEDRTEEWAEVLFRSNEKGIDVVNPTYDSNGNMVSGTFNNAYQRDEHYHQIQNSTFYQINAHLTHDLTDRLKVDILTGASKSVLAIPMATSIMLDDRTAQGYSYNYSNMKSPVLSFGTSVTDPANFQLAEIRDTPSDTNNTFRTFKTDFEWKTTDSLTLKLGGFYREFGFNTWGGTRSTLVCPSTPGKDLVLGTITCSSNSVTNNGFPVTSSMVDTVNLGNAGQPAGTTSTFIVANLPATTAYTNLYNRTLLPDSSNIRSVREADSGFYLQGDWKTHGLGMDITLNGGVRYAHTAQSSTGLQNGTTNVTVQRGYDDWLPSGNLNFFPRKDIILRLAVAKVMTRPSLGNLTPGGSVDSFNYGVSYGNPNLDPYRAVNYDAAVEWYFAPQSLLSVAFFHKDVSSFPTATVTQGTFASTGLPISLLANGSPAAQNPEGRVWTITSIGNGAGAKLNGVELGLQTPLRFLPGPMKNLGVIANATFTNSNATYNVSGPGTSVNANGTITLPASTVTSTFFGLSKTTWNATLYYEKGPFEGRVSYSYRGPYNDQNSGTGNIFEGYGAYASLDAALRYSINKRMEISVDATNLLDRYIDHWTDAATQRAYEYQHTGRSIIFGARYKL
jgi:TonB-dependent receptor